MSATPDAAASRAAGARGLAALPWTDEQVVERVLGGETGLFEILLRRHNQRLFRVARAVLRDDDEAADVLQEAWVRAFAELAQFRAEAPLASWLARIALYEAFRRRRRGRRLVACDPQAGELAEVTTMEPHDDPERGAGNHELRAALRRELDALPDGLRAVFVLREVEGFSTAETAGLLGLSAENVKVRLHRARAALRRGLDTALGSEVRRLYQFDGARCDRMVAAVMARLG